MNARRLVVLAAAAALALGARPARALDPAAIWGAAYPATSNGPCPATILVKFQALLRAPATFTFRWDRSDGVADTTMHAPIANDAVHPARLETTVKLGVRDAKFHPYNGWVKMHVLTPFDYLSDPVKFTLDCGAPIPHTTNGTAGPPGTVK